MDDTLARAFVFSISTGRRFASSRTTLGMVTVPLLLSEDNSLLQMNLQETGEVPVVEQHSRRYLGNKHKLVGFIGSILQERCGDWRSLCDIFAGTGVVGSAFNSPTVRIRTNDLLKSNYICLQAFLGVRRDLRTRIARQLTHLNEMQVSELETNYFSRHFGGTYFSQANAMKIGAMRAEIDRIASDEDERYLLLCALIYAVDKVANTVGHYDAYRKSMDMFQPIRLLAPLVNFERNVGNEIHCEDANRLIRTIECDVLYIDPPYNSRQYSDAYHLLENLTEWKKPEVHGVAKKMNRTHIKSQYCVNGARDALADLVESAVCRHILLSYNNTGESMDGRSNARISDEEIIKILEMKGTVEIFQTQYKAFTTGKGSGINNVERIFYCRVRNES